MKTIDFKTTPLHNQGRVQPSLSHMDKKAVSESLRVLASDDQKRSKAARLREVLDDVEIALAAGITRADVLVELKAHGLDMSLATFETTLKRLRAKRSNTPHIRPAHQDRQSKQLARKPIVLTSPDLPEVADPSHNPADLDKIIRTKPDLAALSKIARRNKQ